MIKACLIDVSKTSVNNGSIYNGIIDLIIGLQEREVRPFFVSNNYSTETRAIQTNPQLSGIDILTKDVVGGKKGSKNFIKHVCNVMRLNKNNIIYVGDDKTDMIEAANTAVIFLYAKWTNTPQNYGIPINNPLDILKFLDLYFKKPYNWGYRVEKRDSLGNPVNIFSLINEKIINEFNQIRSLLKEKNMQVKIGNMLLSEYISYHLLSSIYLEGWHIDKPFWCLYPSSNGVHSGILKIFAENAARMFRESFLEDLLLRYKPARSRSKTKLHGIDPSIDEQLQTIYLNDRYNTKINGKNVILIDDFTTSGKSLEVGRNFLYKAGVNKVYCVTVGKFPTPYSAYTPRIEFNPYAVNIELIESNFNKERLETSSQYNNDLYRYLRDQMNSL